MALMKLLLELGMFYYLRLYSRDEILDDANARTAVLVFIAYVEIYSPFERVIFILPTRWIKIKRVGNKNFMDTDG